MTSEVRDNPARNRFELDVDGHIAFTQYRLSPGMINLIHTEVPKELAGQGVGSRLARGALDAARTSGLKVIATCPFISAWIRKHADYQDLLA